MHATTVQVPRNVNSDRMLPVPVIPERWRMATVCGIAALFLYFGLFRWPLIPFWTWGDQSIYVLHAQRMLNGEVLYRDLFQFNLPGTECLFYVLFRLFGVHLSIAPLVTLTAGVITTGLIFSLSRRVLSGSAAMLPPLLYIVLPLGNRLDATHHTFSTPLVLLAVKIVSDNLSAPRLASASALLALAGLFTSSRGVFVLAAVALYLALVTEDRRAFATRFTALFLPFCAITCSVVFYLIARVGAKTVYYSLLVFPARYYGLDSPNNGVLAQWVEIKSNFPLTVHSLPLLAILACAAMPFLILGFMLGPARKNWSEFRTCSTGRHLLLYALVGGAAVLSVANSANSLRLTCAFPFGVILSLWKVSTTMSDLRVRQFALLTVLFGGFFLTLNHGRRVERVQTPHGPVVMYRVNAEPYAWLVHKAQPGDYFFGDPDLNFIAGLPNPAPVSWVCNNGYTRPEQVVQLLEGLERHHARFVELNDPLREKGGADNSLRPLLEYLNSHYRLGRKFEDGTSIYERLPE